MKHALDAAHVRRLEPIRQGVEVVDKDHLLGLEQRLGVLAEPLGDDGAGLLGGLHARSELPGPVARDEADASTLLGEAHPPRLNRPLHVGHTELHVVEVPCQRRDLARLQPPPRRHLVVGQHHAGGVVVDDAGADHLLEGVQPLGVALGRPHLQRLGVDFVKPGPPVVDGLAAGHLRPLAELGQRLADRRLVLAGEVPDQGGGVLALRLRHDVERVHALAHGVPHDLGGDVVGGVEGVADGDLRPSGGVLGVEEAPDLDGLGSEPCPCPLQRSRHARPAQIAVQSRANPAATDPGAEATQRDVLAGEHEVGDDPGGVQELPLPGVLGEAHPAPDVLHPEHPAGFARLGARQNAGGPASRLEVALRHVVGRAPPLKPPVDPCQDHLLSHRRGHTEGDAHGPAERRLAPGAHAHGPKELLGVVERSATRPLVGLPVRVHAGLHRVDGDGLLERGLGQVCQRGAPPEPIPHGGDGLVAVGIRPLLARRPQRRVARGVDAVQVGDEFEHERGGVLAITTTIGHDAGHRRRLATHPHPRRQVADLQRGEQRRQVRRRLGRLNNFRVREQVVVPRPVALELFVGLPRVLGQQLRHDRRDGALDGAHQVPDGLGRHHVGQETPFGIRVCRDLARHGDRAQLDRLEPLLDLGQRLVLPGVVPRRDGLLATRPSRHPLF